MRIGVTGGSGFLGNNTINELVKRKAQVVSFQRTMVDDTSYTIQPFSLENIENIENLQDTLSSLDVLVHTAAYVHSKDNQSISNRLNFESTRQLVDMCISAKVRKIVFISTVGVYGLSSSSEIVTIDSQTNPKTAYAKAKLRAEKYLLERRDEIEVSIFRFPLIIGKNAPGTYGLLEKFSRLPIPLPFKGLANQRSLICVHQAAKLIAAAAIDVELHTGLHLVARKSPKSTEQLITELREDATFKLNLFKFPSGIIKLLLAVLGKAQLYDQLYRDLRFDSTIDVDNLEDRT